MSLSANRVSRKGINTQKDEGACVVSLRFCLQATCHLIFFLPRKLYAESTALHHRRRGFDLSAAAGRAMLAPPRGSVPTHDCNPC